MKTKPFNLEEYLSDQSQKVVTRDGRNVNILKLNAQNDFYTIVGTVITEGQEEPYSWTKEGSSNFTGRKLKSDLFIVSEEEELTEFEREIKNWMSEFLLGTEQPIPNKTVKQTAKKVLDLARKELEANYYTKVLDDRIVLKSDLHDRDLQGAYEMGKQDALKYLPKWKKDCFHNINSVFDGTLYYNGYYIDINELEKLPKEE